MNRQIRLSPSQLLYILLGIVLITGALITLILVNQNGDSEPDIADITVVTEIANTDIPASPSPSVSPTPSATPTPEATATLQPYSHIVQEGETLYFIIQLYGYRTLAIVPEILLLNGMVDENDIQLGSTILIPRQTPTAGAVQVSEVTSPPVDITPTVASGSDGSSTADAPTEQQGVDYSNCSLDNQCVSADGRYWIHIVQVGETIAGLAFGYGTRVEDIQQANDLYNDIIQPSQQLLIPILVTLTPTLTPTGGPDSTATPVPGFAAPSLLAPANGSAFQRGQTVILQWLSDRPLRGDERYLIVVKNTSTGEEYRAVSTSTIFRLPAELQPDLGEQITYQWTILVVAGTSTTSQVISSLGGAYSLTWG